jgi:peptide subunit release factor 1 (eRF1)
MTIKEQLQGQLERLAAFEPDGSPVVSLYLNTQADQHGRDNYDVFLRKAFKERARTYEEKSAGRKSLEDDLARIERYLSHELQPSTNGLAVFSSSGRDLFEAIQLTAPFDEHWFYINDRPQLYPLARVNARFPTYAAVVADTSNVRIFVFATNELVDTKEVTGVKTRGRSIGGWSQNRYQRRVDNMHASLVREAVEVLDRVVRKENIESVILAGDEVVLPLFRDELPKALKERVIDDIKLPTLAAAHEVLEATAAVIAKHDEATDREKVAAAIAGDRSGGLGVVGMKPTQSALEMGQVDELLISSSPRDLAKAAGGSAGPEAPVESAIERGGAQITDGGGARVADDLVRKATQTAARISFIEDGSLLADYGGVAALLRFRV